MTTARPSDYWFSSSAVFIQRNANGDANYIHANCSAGAAFLCYMRGIPGLGYDAGHNYRRWSLVAYPTVFHDDRERYVYIAVPRGGLTDIPAQFVFPAERIDLYGCNEAGEQIGRESFYYIFTQGILSVPSVEGRVWKQDMDSGLLSSDESIDAGGAGTWWEYLASEDSVRFLKTIYEATFRKLTAAWASLKQLVLNGHELNGVAGSDTAEDAADHVVTPAYASEHYLSKIHEDVAKGPITFDDTITVRGETVLKRTLTVGDFETDVQVGLGSKSGMRLSPEGRIVARSLELSESLEVPVLKYNSIEVLAGTRWDSAGKGRVREVISADEGNHICRFVLDLNDGEPGELVVNDILRGFWHSMDASQNAAENADDRRGNIRRAGFLSLYCRVTEVADVVERTQGDVTTYLLRDDDYVPREGDRVLSGGLVTVQARQLSAETDEWSPLPEQWAVLSVSGHFGTDHPERQNFFVYTTCYMARFEGVNTWEWEEHTFMGGWGDLTGFVMLRTDDDGHVSRKEFSGEGFVTKDAHIYGVLDQFTRFSDRIEVRLSRPDGTVADGESLRADFVLLDVEGAVIASAFTLGITRQSADAEADAQWNADMAARYPDGIPQALQFAFADVPEMGAVYVVAAQRTVRMADGSEEVYTTSASFVLSRAYAQEIFMGEWDAATAYTRTARTYPTVTHGGCKWYLVAASSVGDEPSPLSRVWNMVFGIQDLEIRFYNDAGQRILVAAAYPGNVDIFLSPRLLCGNYDITTSLSDSAWTWERYVGNYGEETDSRTPDEKAMDEAWPRAHWPLSKPTREVRLTNIDFPPLWGSSKKVVNFIVTATYDGEKVTNTVSI